MDLGLKGKTAVITGGSGGIGQGLVLEFAREGLNVISASRDATTGQTLVEKGKEMGLPGQILPVSTDVTDRASVDAMVKACHEAFGPIDILINNAGGACRPNEFEQLDKESRDWEIALNIDGVVNCCQAVADDMIGRGTGSIVNISSNSSLLGEGSFWSKFGFEMMGRPDEMQTALEEGTLYNMSGLPIPRLGRPDDIANLCLFLSSDKAGYITGQMISVSGGAYMH